MSNRAPPLTGAPLRQVSSLDGDGRALVKMAVTGDTSSLPEGALQPVTKKDYKRNSRVISESLPLSRSRLCCRCSWLVLPVTGAEWLVLVITGFYELCPVWCRY